MVRREVGPERDGHRAVLELEQERILGGSAAPAQRREQTRRQAAQHRAKDQSCGVSVMRNVSSSERCGHYRRHERRDVAAHRGDLADKRGGDVAGLRARRQENRLQPPAPSWRSCRPSASRSRDRCRRAGRGSGSSAPTSRAKSTTRLSKVVTLDGRRRPPRPSGAATVSISSAGRRPKASAPCRMDADATTSRSHERNAARSMSTCPLVSGSNLPG